MPIRAHRLHTRTIIREGLSGSWGGHVIAASARKGPGRSVTKSVVEKCWTVYSKFAKEPSIVELIAEGQRVCGRQCVFEDYSKLCILAGGGRSIEEIAWIMQQILLDQKLGKASDGYSQGELLKKGGPVSVYHLRKMAIQGILDQFVKPAMQVCADTSKEICKEALRTMMSNCQTPHSFARSRQDTSDTSAQGLPIWASLKVGKILRQVFDGAKDRGLMQLCHHLPKGGFQSIRYAKDISKLDVFADALADVAKDYESWAPSMRAPADEATGEDPPGTTMPGHVSCKSLRVLPNLNNARACELCVRVCACCQTSRF